MRRTLLLTLVLAMGVACGGPPLPPRAAPAHINEPAALVEEYYRRLNAEDLAGLMALFAGDPVLVEPFSAPEHATTHRGYEAVARFYQRVFRERDDSVVPEYVRPEGGTVAVGWSATGADGAGVSGTARFELRGGQIARVDIQQRE